MHRIDMLRWSMTGGTPASCANKPYTPAYCDAELWKIDTAAGEVGASCTGSVAGAGCCGVNNLVNGDGTTQSGCVLEFDDGTLIKVPWKRIMGTCSVGVATNVTPALCAAADGTWVPAGGLAYTFMTLPLIPRMGLLAFEDTGPVDGVYIGDYTATGVVATDEASINLPNYPFMNLITHLNSIPPQNGTPTGAALWDALNYFEQNSPKYTDTGEAVASFKGLAPSPSSGTDNYRNPMFSCGNGGSNCVFVPCAGNYVILLSDGGWNVPSCSISASGTSTSCTSQNNADPVVPAYCMHETFENKISSTNTSVNSVYTIALFPGVCSKSGNFCEVAGTAGCSSSGVSGDSCKLYPGALALENVSMYGSFNNAQKTWPDSLIGFPATSCTDSVDCTSTAVGSLCTALPASSPDWCPAGNGIPATSFTAASASEIRSGLLTAVQSILQQSTSGTAVSILASGQGSGANLLQAVFYPQMAFADAEVAWVGQMQNLWYYLDPKLQSNTIREDTVHDYILELKQDNVVNFIFDTSLNKTMADLYVDTTGTGNPLTFRIEENLDQLTNLWEAGYMLWSRNETTSPRTLYTSTTGTSLTNFVTGNATPLEPFLQAASVQESTNLINYISGIDVQYCSVSTVTCTSNANCTGGSGDTCISYRPRTAALSLTAPNNTDNVWKLGDIISSTPKIQSWVPLDGYASSAPNGYNDGTYAAFTQSQNYKNLGTVYAGANDGMFHAFTLGLLNMVNNADPFQIAELCADPNPTGSGLCPVGFSTAGLGSEMWAYLPKNTLPYLRYFANPDYCHLFYVDGTPYLFDASINAPTTCSANDYSLCTRQTKCTGDATCQGTGPLNILDLTNTSWRTVIIGSMGTGGACRQSTATCNVSVCQQHPGTTCTTSTTCPNYSSGETCLPDCVLAPVADPSNTANSLGYSSYFAMDVTTPSSPALLWEFSNPGLGFATAGPAVLRVNGGAPALKPGSSSNGKWFVVLASGPTGPIDPASYQFLGSSDQDLSLFIIDLKTGALLRTIDTGLKNAFAGSIVNASIDTDRWNPGLPGNYEDNVLYIGYTQLVGGAWQGGVLRLTTGGGTGIDAEDSNVANWKLSTVITVPGAVTTSVSFIQDRTNHELWLYFGTGRYFWKIGTNVDDANTQQALYGIKEPCYSNGTTPAGVPTDSLSMTCTSTVSTSGLINSTTSPPSSDAPTGWFINLAASTTSNYAERVVTDPLAAFTGAAFFTTFEPSTAACGFSGNSYLWAVNYNTGGSAPASALSGSALLQVSTGQVQQVTLSSAFTGNVPTGGTQGRTSAALLGVPPKGQGLSVIIQPRPLNKVLQIQEK